MKKKLNLLWNLKFNFFSVAERPLTFFAYFLNAKKVGRRRLVIVPATAGGLPLFPHAASVPAPALAPVRSHFTPRPPPCAVVRFAAMTSSPRTNVLAYPAFASLKRGPSANNPALVAVRLHFATRNRSVGRCLRRGGNRKPRVGKEESPPLSRG